MKIRQIARWMAAGLLIGGLVSWAIFQVFFPPASTVANEPFTTATVAEGKVGLTLPMNTSATWTATSRARNRAIGTVTSTSFDETAPATNGEVLYSVDMRPVVLGLGQVPAYRALAEGAEGQDVVQLQGVLAAGGWFNGSPDGVFGYSTTRAVRTWQKSLNIVADGVVQISDVIYVPQLPGKVLLDVKTVYPGALLAGDEIVVSALGDQPDFSIAVTEQQSHTIPLGAEVRISAPNGETWVARVDDVVSDDSKQIWLRLVAADKTSICSESCATLPSAGENLLLSEVVVVPEVTGLVLPTAALKTSGDGKVLVFTPGGVSYPVKLVASARGMSVIEGLDSGFEVRMPAERG